ncbi:aminoacyl-tRNA hydrolase [Sphingorhabdus lutea]|uniref:Aminoacyl-tRNA hydrolase n=2 Tax=Sphingorhabdus lutea TaxID=1913578 RepID=A0A1L3JF88_9SPHN|nr:alternative ribosome rescue aminoacyl-tRNA hydrolase ArfB [Sphingorhabdus lutea]APG63808.1 aminoacyl-tRNA hydrolase [Sphingorhabdus lutea]
MTFVIPEKYIQESFLASTGPGGQNVNKVATACQLRVNIFALRLAPDVYRRLRIMAGSKITDQGELIITARKYRSQQANRDDARMRAQQIIAEAHIRPVRRVATKPSRAAKAKRVDGKKSRATIKKNRGKVRME